MRFPPRLGIFLVSGCCVSPARDRGRKCSRQGCVSNSAPLSRTTIHELLHFTGHFARTKPQHITPFRKVSMSAELVTTFQEKRITARATDNYVNATELCKAAGKLWANYWRNDGTQDFIQALAESMRIRADSLIQAKSGRGGGTWIHPRVAMHFAQWVSPTFAVQVSVWVLQLLTTGRVELPTAAVQPVPGKSLEDLLAIAARSIAEYRRLEGRVEVVEDAVQEVRVLAECANVKAERRERQQLGRTDDAIRLLQDPTAVKMIEARTAEKGSVHRELAKMSGVAGGTAHKALRKLGLRVTRDTGKIVPVQTDPVPVG